MINEQVKDISVLPTFPEPVDEVYGKDLNIYKGTIVIPKGIRFVGEDWGNCEKPYRLEDYPFPHILNKVLTGCGYTEYCIKNPQNLILCSPRKMLLENKKDQHPEFNVYYAVNNVEENTSNYERTLTESDGKRAANRFYRKIEENKNLSASELNFIKSEIMNYKEKIKQHYLICKSQNAPCKILVTYDSFHHVKEALQEIGALDDFQVVVDEFQSILVDVKFKSNTEMEFLYHLKDIQKLCYVSATPTLDKYLLKLDDFKDLPFYEFDWLKEDPARLIKPKLRICNMGQSLASDVSKIIFSYRSGKFEKESWVDDSGKIQQIESKEAVIYLNSVTSICMMITKCELLPSECNILVARTKDNDDKIRRAFNEVYEKQGNSFRIDKKVSVIGSVPAKGESHKMFTFCTRTVYLGADFYSTNARTFIFCNSNIDCLCVDVSMDLPQILGRQRLDENPWRNEATIYVQTTVSSWTREDFENNVKKKLARTDNLLDAYNECRKELKHDLAETYEKAAIIGCYQNDYLAVNRHAGSDLKPVFNQLMLVAEERAYDIQQQDYASRVSIFNTIQKKGFDTVEVENELNQFNFLGNYDDKMKYICDQEQILPSDKFKLLLDSVPRSFKNYFTVLGPTRCRANKYRQLDMEREYQKLLNNQSVSLDDKIFKSFNIGDRYTYNDIKAKLEEIYQDSGYQQTVRATDIKQYFDTKKVKINDPVASKRVDGLLILSKRIT